VAAAGSVVRRQWGYRRELYIVDRGTVRGTGAVALWVWVRDADLPRRADRRLARRQRWRRAATTGSHTAVPTQRGVGLNCGSATSHTVQSAWNQLTSGPRMIRRPGPRYSHGSPNETAAATASVLQVVPLDDRTCHGKAENW